jgi:hypothetical protein
VEAATVVAGSIVNIEEEQGDQYNKIQLEELKSLPAVACGPTTRPMES